MYVFFFVFEQANAEHATVELSCGPKLAATNCRWRLALQGVLKFVPIGWFRFLLRLGFIDYLNSAFVKLRMLFLIHFTLNS